MSAAAVLCPPKSPIISPSPVLTSRSSSISGSGSGSRSVQSQHSKSPQNKGSSFSSPVEKIGIDDIHTTGNRVRSQSCEYQPAPTIMQQQEQQQRQIHAATNNHIQQIPTLSLDMTSASVGVGVGVTTTNNTNTITAEAETETETDGSDMKVAVATDKNPEGQESVPGPVSPIQQIGTTNTEAAISTKITIPSSSTAIIPYHPPSSSSCQQNNLIIPTPLLPTSLCTIASQNADSTIPYRGLVNLGNTCYLNSALQMLMSVDGFMDDIIDLYERDQDVDVDVDVDVDEDFNATYANANNADADVNANERNENQQEKMAVQQEQEQKDDSNETMLPEMATATATTAVVSPSDADADKDQNNLEGDGSEHHHGEKKKRKSKYPLRDALAKFFLSVKNPPTPPLSTPSSTPSAIITPSPLFETVPIATPVPVLSTSTSLSAINPSSLKQVIDEMSPLFVGYWQQDSHEFLSTVLDLLHDEIIAAEKKNVTPSPTPKEEGCLCQEKDKQGEGCNGDVVKMEMELAEKKDDDTSVEEDLGGSFVITKEDETGASSSLISMKNSVEKCQDESKHLASSNDSEDDDATIDGSDYVLVETSTSGTPESITRRCHSKKARVSSPKTIVDEGSRSRSRSRSGSPQCLSRVSSYSTLGLDDINELLHGKSDCDGANGDIHTTAQRIPLGAGCSRVECKLVGGRIAPLLNTPPVISEEKDEEDSQSPPTIDTAHDASNMPETNTQETETGSTPMSMDTESCSETSNHQPQHIDTIVDNYFTMDIRVHLTCDSCNYSRSHNEVYRHLSIDVGSGSSDNNDNATACTPHDRTIQEGLRKFFAPEKRELKCEKCFCESATQKMEITRLPRALIVHLKRFIVDVSEDYSRVTYKKNQDCVELHGNLPLDKNEGNGVLGEFLAVDTSFPLRTTSPQSCAAHTGDTIDEDNIDAMSMSSEEDYVGVNNKAASQQYQIRSVVNHIGTSANCGHYTADAFRLYGNCDSSPEQQQLQSITSSASREWTRFNDSFVSRITEENAMGPEAQKTAYMVMYQFE